MLEIFSQLVAGFFEHLIADVRDSVSGMVETYLLSTYDFSTLHPQPLTSNAALQAMHHLTLGIADLLLVIVLMWAFFRSQWERSFRAHYTVKVVLPRALAAVAFAHFSLLIGQMAIDLNNALVHAVWTTGLPGTGSRFPWAFAFSHQFGLPLFELGVRLVIVVMLVIVALTYVVRFALIAVLLVLAPLAALCVILPETKQYARAWNRLFLTTVFMQFVQVLILRFASIFLTEQYGNPVQALYGLAVLYLIVKVPGLMNASGHLEVKLEHLVQGAVKHAVKAAAGSSHAAATR